jgi:hypothetical protein
MFHFLNGKVKVVSDKYLRRSDALILRKEDWKRVGATDVTMNIPGASGRAGDFVVQPLTGNKIIFRSYAFEALFCRAPFRSCFITGITPGGS